MSKNLASKAVSGIKWGSASTFANAVMQIGYTSVMARLLAPEAFGLVSIAGTILGFSGYFANMGLSKAIIQKEDITADNIRAAFTTSVALGIFFFLLTWIIAPFSAIYFKEPNVAPIVRVMGLVFLINGLSMTAISLLEREMRFKTIGIIETSSYIFSYLVVGIILAYLDFGVWALVYASLMQSLTYALGAYFSVRHSVLPSFKWESFKPLFDYGSRMSLISFMEYISANLPTVLIGRFLGTHKLGLYSRAFMLVNLPMYQLTRTLIKVAMPSYSRLQSDNEKLGKVYLSSITLLAALIMPICLGIMVAAPEIIRIVLGDQWGESVPVLQVLALAIPMGFITMFAGIVCDAKAILNPKIILNILFIVVICVFFLLFRDYGLVGFAGAVLLGEFVRMLMYQQIMHKELDLPHSKQLAIYMPGLINGVLVAVGIYIVSTVMRSAELPALAILIAQMATGAVLLLVLTLLFPHKLLRQELQIVFEKIGLQGKTDSYLHKIIQRTGLISE
ncbi:lipopolysaccharide biosynthesis protein [Pontibacter fetidus]|uniref:Lipopolysaccharide biosynthesis protein n=1 Tax=Pontibacter fetidus TaxID=2700082 RepID=A0A6B2H9B7_9BACT|nr:lipopolysaccharide biosynthesis protein [Pontibacter fetidus]NDK55854.1 lipopolysaccharide biosynthesis protein [Pontibacter fetidus]